MPARAPALYSSSRAADAETAAHYIAAMTRDLALIAQQNGLGTLGYLLDIARLEAENASRLSAGRGA